MEITMGMKTSTFRYVNCRFTKQQYDALQRLCRAERGQGGLIQVARFVEDSVVREVLTPTSESASPSLRSEQLPEKIVA
jgi:hypothetical protein